MKNPSLVTVMLTGLLAWPGVAWSQSAAGDATLVKIGVINLQYAIANTAEGKKASQDIQKKYQPRSQQLQQMNQEVQSLNDQLQRQAATLSDDERIRLNRELEEKQKILKRAQEDAQTEYQEDTQEVSRRILQKMNRLVADYAQQNGFTLILEDGPQTPIYYAAPQIDLTEEIIKRYDTANPAEGATSSTTPSAPSGKTPAAPKGTATKTPNKAKP